VARTFDALRSDAPQTDGPVWLVVLLAEAWVHWEDVRAYRREYGWQDQETGQPRPRADLERRLRSEIADYIDALGLSPRSAARLGLDVARGRDLAMEWAREAAEEGTSEGAAPDRPSAAPCLLATPPRLSDASRKSGRWLTRAAPSPRSRKRSYRPIGACDRSACGPRPAGSGHRPGRRPRAREVVGAGDGGGLVGLPRAGTARPHRVGERAQRQAAACLLPRDRRRAGAARFRGR
jgi:hypothetical protein